MNLTVTIPKITHKIVYFHYCLSILCKICTAAARKFLSQYQFLSPYSFLWGLRKKLFSIPRYCDQSSKEPNLNFLVRIRASMEILVKVYFLFFISWHSIYFLVSSHWFNCKHIMTMQITLLLGKNGLVSPHIEHSDYKTLVSKNTPLPPPKKIKHHSVFLFCRRVTSY